MMIDNHLYDRLENRYLIDSKLRRLAKKDMTFILGAKCIDGIVLVGDTKVTIDEGMDYTYGRKLIRPFTTAVLGAAGISGLFSSFHSRFMVNFIGAKQKVEKFDSHEMMKILVENTIREMHKVYGKDSYIITRNLRVLVAMRMQENAELVCFDGLGFPEPVDTIRVIGSGESYGALFVKKMWNANMTMEQTAKLALFVIDLIQDTEMTASVGYRKDCLPQVFYLPNVKVDESLRNSQMSETQFHEKSVELHTRTYPIQELSKEIVRDYLKATESIKTRLLELLKDSQSRL